MNDRDAGSDRLDRLLRRDAQAPLPDEGFTARVLGALPARVGWTDRAWVTPALVLGSAALGSALAIVLAPAGSNVVQGFIDIAASHSHTPAALTGFAMTGALLLCAIVLALDTE